MPIYTESSLTHRRLYSSAEDVRGILEEWPYCHFNPSAIMQMELLDRLMQFSSKTLLIKAERGITDAGSGEI